MATSKAMKAKDPGHFEFRGVKLSIPLGDDVPIDAIEAFEAGKTVTYLRLVLGEDQWQKVRDTGAKTVKDLFELAECLAEAMGSNSGE